jgi:BASS family bile acid:Na+ symporter
MSDRRHLLSAVARLVHGRFLGLLLGSYALAALWPGPGLWLRDVSFGEAGVLGERVRLSLPLLLLAFLLGSAGLGVRAGQLRELLRRPWLLGAGLVANLLLPVAFLLGMTRALWLWHNPDEVQTILVGLALVAAMPVAGSAAAWAQRADGDLALGLGLVVFSTLLSPLTTPLALHAAGLLATGDYAVSLHGLAAHGSGGFLAVGVALPSLLGLLGRAAAGEAVVERLRPALRLTTSLTLLLLNYANAAVSLPQVVADPDWDFLAVLLALVVGLCVCAFAAGWGLAYLLRAGPAQRAALMFGLGMSNNGTGLVLAATALAAHPRVLLPVIGYNLVQHLVAGGVDVTMARARSRVRRTEY